MKYKLINTTTNQETLCDKVTIDGFDYYVSDENIHFGYVWNTILEQIETMFKEKTFHDDLKGVIATNNPNINIPKVVDEVEILAKEYVKGEEVVPFHTRKGFISGYNKSQEDYPFSEEDMVEFQRFCCRHDYENGFGKTDRKELLKLWKEQQPKIVWYE